MFDWKVWLPIAISIFVAYFAKKQSDSAKFQAAASKTQADAAKSQADAAIVQANAAKIQAAAALHQIKLSILPSFTAKLVPSDNHQDLKSILLINIGNGTAHTVQVAPIPLGYPTRMKKITGIFNPQTIEVDEILTTEAAFATKEILFIENGKEVLLEKRDWISPNGLSNAFIIINQFDLLVTFKDIEGTQYKQVIHVSYGTGYSESPIPD